MTDLWGPNGPHLALLKGVTAMKGKGSGIGRMSVMRRNEAIAGYVFMLPLLLGIVFLTYGQFV